VSANQAGFSVATMCRVLGLSQSAYYASRRRPPSARSLMDSWLLERIQASHAGSRGTYGAPRIHADLAAQGIRIGQKRVARLMREAGLEGVSPRKWVTTTIRSEGDPVAQDLVRREFQAEAPDKLWVSDITYVPTLAGFLYLAIVLDVWSRKVVGWAMSPSLATPLVLAALEMAVRQRQPKGTVHHSDQGCQYTSVAFGKHLIDAGLRPSMGSVGDAYDNAMAESFFSTLESELLARTRFESRDQARREVFSFIEGWYNPAVGTPPSATSHPTSSKRPPSWPRSPSPPDPPRRRVNPTWPPPAAAEAAHAAYARRRKGPERPHGAALARRRAARSAPPALCPAAPGTPR
jgi:putative transposase